jgi:hypothetical protein
MKERGAGRGKGGGKGRENGEKIQKMKKPPQSNLTG